MLTSPLNLSGSRSRSIEFQYTATGEKLKKTVKETGKPDVTISYVAGMVYRNDTLQFMPTSEGRAFYQPLSLTNKWHYEYQYKDHLGNLRLAFRQQPAQLKAASMEQSQSQQEEADFDNVALTRHLDATKARTGTAFAKLNAMEGKPIGPLRQFSVHRGDSISATAQAFFPVANRPDYWPLLSFVSSWFSPAPQTGSEFYTATNKFTPYLSLGLAASVPAIQNTQDAPTAYLKYIVYDADSNYVTSGIRLVSELAQENWEELLLGYKVEQDGFVQIFVSNDSNVDAYFDDIAISHIPALIVQENHYDPWGQDLVGINKRGNPHNLYQYNGKEHLSEFGLEWDDFGWRSLDKQLGRWHVVDPSAERDGSWSPYVYGFSNPILFSDPDGRWPDGPGDRLKEFGKGVGTGLYNYGKSTVQGIAGLAALTNPVTGALAAGQMYEGAKYTVNNPGKVAGAVGDAIKGQYNKLQNGSVREQGEVVGGMFGVIGEVAIGAEVSKIGSASKSNVYRVFGGDAKPDGFSWTPTNPNKVSNFRDAAGLPSGGASGSNNTGRFVIEGSVDKKNIIKQRAALPLDGNAGGLPELIIDPKNVTIKRVSGVNPEF